MERVPRAFVGRAAARLHTAGLSRCGARGARGAASGSSSARLLFVFFGGKKNVLILLPVRLTAAIQRQLCFILFSSLRARTHIQARAHFHFEFLV